MYRITICIRSDDTIRPNTNTLLGALFGTKRIFGTTLVNSFFYFCIVSLVKFLCFIIIVYVATTVCGEIKIFIKFCCKLFSEIYEINEILQ